MREYARQWGLRRRLVTTRLLTPRMSRGLVAVLAPEHGQVAAEMVESMHNETTVDGHGAIERFGVDAEGVSAAIERALTREDLEFSQRSWSDSQEHCERLRWGGIAAATRRVSSAAVRVERRPGQALQPPPPPRRGVCPHPPPHSSLPPALLPP